ncbi:exopolysaccharide biosynthesis WecB/TagA/CpsF family protein [Actinoplanes lutulentus]|uniref:Exopolysaccharide biosynthesis WecB/TagA/CpsF family protein n=1 Tax=Actinoplanes lutulentus TaxID=1287878 RepID=A0A327Z9G1_9ACTN|nr:WecB/TagA/CpsF family glycosyltransferase [Actinoplanes lutulentus]MBB2944844.1 exopolysaccharide biosynthesis WecB/TagA/CpsF family protein [Actinoplanes lutulentus]RAK35364.1 exopolysaccharide biosynthesis WecB/TagA/CpsF family protein [Actinoplanes lutulentus]
MSVTGTVRGKRNVLGVLVDVTDYAEAVDLIVAAAREQRPFAVTALAVHGVMTGVEDFAHNGRLNSFDLVTPDGQPVRWALNLLHGAGLTDRVYGPSLTLKVVEQAAAEGLPIYLYGSTQPVLDRLVPAFQEMFPALKIVGIEPSKFRKSLPGEELEIAERIKSSGARIVLVGLGCPRQEIFTYAMRPHLDMPLLAVGAAFDYHAGLLKNPPAWMQKYALEWLWRLGLEPKRLWKRYILLNPAYLARLFAQKLGIWKATAPAPTTERVYDFAV